VKRRSRGEGSIYFLKSKGLWVSKITLPDGTYKVKYGKFQKDVRTHHQDSLSQLRRGILPKDDAITIGEFLESYMETVGKNKLRPRTQEMYLSLIRCHIVPSLGKVKLTELRPDHLQNFYSIKLKSGLSKRTVQLLHSTLRRVLNQAVTWEMISRNVCKLVQAPRPDRKAPAFYTQEQINILLNQVRGHSYFLIYLLLVSGGFREGEVLGIMVEDYDRKNRTVNVRHAVLTLKGGLVVTEPKTESSKRAVVLPKTAALAMEKHIDQLNKKQGLIFTTRSGKPISPRNLIRHFKLAIKSAGLPDITVHGLRHSHASYLLAKGLNPKIVQERLGHASIVLTLTTYSHVIPSLQDMAAEKVEDMFT
jgi:integrase